MSAGVLPFAHVVLPAQQDFGVKMLCDNLYAAEPALRNGAEHHHILHKICRTYGFALLKRGWQRCSTLSGDLRWSIPCRTPSNGELELLHIHSH